MWEKAFFFKEKKFNSFFEGKNKKYGLDSLVNKSIVFKRTEMSFHCQMVDVVVR